MCRIPIPGAPFEKGTISICRLTYLKEEEKKARKGLGQEGWFKSQKQAALGWKNHILAKPNLPPDRFVEHEYYKNFDHVYPRGIDAKRNDKKEKDLETLRMLTGGADSLKNKGYRGKSEKAKKQREIDKEMQRLVAAGVSDRERRIILRNMGGGDDSIITAGNLQQHLNKKVKETAHERKGRYNKAHLGQFDFKPNDNRKDKIKKELGEKKYKNYDYNSYSSPKKEYAAYELFNRVDESNKELS